MNTDIEKLLEQMKSHRNRVRIENRQLMQCECNAKLAGMNEMIKIVEQMKFEKGE